VLVGGKLEDVVPPGQFGTMMVIYGLGYVAIFTVFALLYLHAYRRRNALALSALERHDTRERVWANLLNAVVGAVSVAIAGIGGSRYSLWAGLTYVLIGPVMTVHGSIMGGRRRRLQEREAADVRARGEGADEAGEGITGAGGGGGARLATSAVASDRGKSSCRGPDPGGLTMPPRFADVRDLPRAARFTRQAR
jgi:hypothetical protein